MNEIIRSSIIFLVILFLLSLAFGIFQTYRIRIITDSYEMKIKEREIELRDEAFKKIDSLAFDFQLEIEAMSKEKEKIKYIPYERIEYRDRSIIDAVDILDRTEYAK